MGKKDNKGRKERNKSRREGKKEKKRGNGGRKGMKKWEEEEGTKGGVDERKREREFRYTEVFTLVIPKPNGNLFWCLLH